MVCQCKIKLMKKPSRLPPPPPPPPKSTIPSYNYYNGPDSEYSEGPISVQSVPHALIQRSFSPSVGYNSARSESGIYYSATMSLRSECSSTCCNQCYPSTRATCCNESQHSIESAPPVPRVRIFRPKISISPKPELKNKNDRPRPRYRCNSLNYRRHIEQHIERVSKYLKDRRERLNECESDISARKLRPQDVESVKKMLASKETRYLRSLRTRLSPKDFEEIKELGSGYIGNVWLVKKREDRFNSFSDKPNLYAMKKLRKTQVFQQNHMAHVMAERDILAEADNEWIVKLYYSFQDEKYLYFILEYIPGGDMMNLLYQQNVFPEEWARFYIAEISLALQFVHDMNFIHRDIKPDNILIDAKGHIKLTDFGLCRGNRWTHDLSYYRDDQHVDNNNHDEHPTITTALSRREIEHSLRRRTPSLVGSPNYIAPEVLKQESTNEILCDWWSVGVILYEMVIGYCPFIDLEKLKAHEYNPEFDPPDRIQWRILNWRKHLAFPSPNDPNAPPLMADVNGIKRYISRETRDLIERWLCEPNDRLCQFGISDIQDHPFFRGINWQQIRSMPAPYVPELSDELDTRHFDNASVPFGREATIGPGSEARMSMNDFTYRSFWNRPRSD